MSMHVSKRSFGLAGKLFPAPVRVRLESINQELAEVLDARTISGLDGIRALAITLVLIDHFELADYVFSRHLGLGSFGVTIFFVLSGFLITAMLLREHRKTGCISLANFYRGRTYRIFPTFYCCWILTTLVECLSHSFSWKPALASFFYLMDYWRAFTPENIQEHMWVSWSLAIEEKFYLLWPPLLLLLLRKRPTLIRMMASIILGQWIYRAILYLVFNVRGGYVYNAFDMRADALLVGCMLSILMQNEKARFYCCGLLRWQWLSILPPLALALMAVFVPSNKVAFLLLWTIQPVIAGAMLLQAAYWGAKAWTICGSAIVRITAHLSYALYLYHPLAGKIVYALHARHVGYSAAVLTLLMANASYYLLERPFMRMRDRRTISKDAESLAKTVQPVAVADAD